MLFDPNVRFSVFQGANEKKILPIVRLPVLRFQPNGSRKFGQGNADGYLADHPTSHTVLKGNVPSAVDKDDTVGNVSESGRAFGSKALRLLPGLLLVIQVLVALHLSLFPLRNFDQDQPGA
jgi:hypothetical protein